MKMMGQRIAIENNGNSRYHPLSISPQHQINDIGFDPFDVI